jgi:hypothetical protein
MSLGRKRAFLASNTAIADALQLPNSRERGPISRN